MGVRWKPVDRSDLSVSYEVSSSGLVCRSGNRDHCLNFKERGNRLLVQLARHGSNTTLHVAQLVALAFLGPPPSPDSVLVFKNGDTKDNRASNLKWVAWDEARRLAACDRVTKTRTDTQSFRSVGLLETMTEAQWERDNNIRLQLSYLAGALDSDGHISLQRTHKKRDKTDKYHLVVGFTGTASPPVVHELFVKLFGGSVYQHQPRKPNTRRVYMWLLSHDKAALACRALLPYLRTKKRQAAIGLRFQEIRASLRSAAGFTHRMPSPSEKEQFHDLWIEMGSLNQPRNRRVHFQPRQETRAP